MVTESVAQGQTLAVRSRSTRNGLGHPTSAHAVLDLSGLTGIVDYQPAELVLTARPATPLAEIHDVLAQAGQCLAFEPGESGSLAGALATNHSGPRRFRSGAARDHLLGFEAVTGRGERFVAGGRVVKNVTGYDLSKLMCGSFGTLAVLTLVHVKVWPAPKAVTTVVRRESSPDAALAALTTAVSSPHDPTGAAWAHDTVAVRLEGPPSSVAHRAQALGELLEADEYLDEAASRAWWGNLVPPSEELWCVSVPPTNAVALVQATHPGSVAFDWAGGRVWLGFSGTGPDVRSHMPQGHATLVRASDTRKSEVGVFPPLPEPLAALERRVKAQFDPAGILEPRTAGAMKTSFTKAQLSDPELQVGADQLRKCVHCGFCLATCPTYVVQGNELDSPRGRIVLMQEFLETGEPSVPLVHHVDRCLSCLACQTTCPSGVDYMHLVDHTRSEIERSGVRPWTEQWFRRALGWVVSRPFWFRLGLAAAPLGRALAPWLPTFLRPLVELAPTARVRRFRPSAVGVGPPQRTSARPQYALLTGCVQSVLDAEVHEATVRVLERLGATVVVVDDLGCCGAVPAHLGQHDTAMARVRANVRALAPHLPSLSGIVSTVAGCGTMLEDYGHLLRHDPFANDAARVSALACDVLEAVQAVGLPDGLTAREPRRIAFHTACSLQHGQRVHSGPALLRALGHTVVEPAEAHLCCGSAGTYNLLQPELAATLGDRKAAALHATQPDLIVAGNVGCALQIGARTELLVRHPIQLVDDALR